MSKQTSSQRGSILLVFLITLPFLILIALYYSRLALVSYQVARQDQQHTAAQLSADAGADFAVNKISLDNAWTGTTSEQVVHSDPVNRSTYTVEVTDASAGKKLLKVVGRGYSPVTATVPKSTITIYVDLRPVSSGNYGIISGEGGLFMSNSSKIVGGDVFINGAITMSGSSQIGLSTLPLSIKVAHQTCPVPATTAFPRVCASGENGQPISISNPAQIYGTVMATNQISGIGMSNPGLVSGSVAPQPLPTYDRAAQKAAVVTTMTGAAASCSGSQNITYPANLKITGDVSIGIQCKVTVLGNVWITGKLNVANSAVMTVADSLGLTRPNIMVDGIGGALFLNSAKLASNASGTGFEIYTFYSTASCSPDCSNLAGPDLFNSSSITTIDLRNSASAPNTIFYAYWSQVSIGNTGAIGAVIGQTINMSNSGTLTFGASASTGGPTIYVVQGYRRN